MAELKEIPDIFATCQYSSDCGGCDYLDMSYVASLNTKLDEFKKTMMCLNGVKKVMGNLQVIPSPNPTHWRTRCQLQIQNGKLGFFKKKTHELIEIKECLMLDKRLNKRISELKFPKDVNGKIELYIKNENVCERFVEKKYENLFLQVNETVNNILIEKVIALIEPQKKDNILELYCGLGNFTYPMARKARVIGVDINVPQNSREKKIEFIEIDALNGVKDLSNKNRLVTFNKLLLDPPRSGAGTHILKELLQNRNFKKIVYVSCNTEAFVKDAEFLMANSYRLENIIALDMFPFSKYLETVNLFLITEDTKPAIIKFDISRHFKVNIFY